MSLVLNNKGFWDSLSNTPFLQDGVGTIGDAYRITYNSQSLTPTTQFVERDFGSGIVSCIVASYLIYDGSHWYCNGNISNSSSTSGVTSVNASGSTGISVTGGPITSTGTFIITNTQPDKIVTLSGSSGISISSNYPNFGLSVSGNTSGTVTSIATNNGLSGGTITSLGTIGLAAISGSSVLANTSGSTGIPNQALPYSSQFGTTNNLVARDINGNTHANNFESAITELIATASTTILTAASTRLQTYTTGSHAIMQLPDATTLHNGHTFEINNNASGFITVTDNSSTTICSILNGAKVDLTLLDNSTIQGVWDYHWLMPSSAQYGAGGLSVNGVINATEFITSGGLSSQFVKGDGSLDSNQYLTSGSTSALYVPYTGANSNVNLGNYSLSGNTAEFNKVNVNSPSYANSTVNINGSLLILSGTTPIILSNAIIDTEESINNYLQQNTRNASNGNNASGDYVVTADTGSDTTNYVDLGINSSGFSQPTWTINGALDSYLYASNGNLAIGTASGKVLDFFTSGTTSANRRMRIDSSGNTFIYNFTNNGGVLYTNSNSQILQTSSGSTNQILTLSGTTPIWSTMSMGVSPGGVQGNIQYNISGTTFGGATFVDIYNGNLQLSSQTSIPSIPTSGSSLIYSNNQTGIDEVHVIPSVGIESILQNSIGQKNIGWNTLNGTSSVGYYGNWNGAFTQTGSIAYVVKSYDGTNKLPNYSYYKLATAASTSSSAEQYMNSAYSSMLIDTSAYGAGGKLIITFGLPVYASTERIFVGWYSSTSAGSSSTDPSSWLNTIGLSKDTGDSTFQFCYNNSSGTATKVNTTVTPNSNNVYRLTINVPAGSSTAYQTLEVLTKTTITTYNSSNSAKFPSAGTFMDVHQYVNTASGSAAVSMAYILGYSELY